MTRQIKKKILLENEIKSFVNFFVDILLFFVGSKFSNIYIYICVCVWSNSVVPKNNRFSPYFSIEL